MAVPSESTRSPALPVDYDDLARSDVLYDRHRREYYVVEGFDDSGVNLRQQDCEFYVPHSLFVPWYGSRIFRASKMTDAQLPDWI